MTVHNIALIFIIIRNVSYVNSKVFKMTQFDVHIVNITFNIITETIPSRVQLDIHTGEKNPGIYIYNLIMKFFYKKIKFVLIHITEIWRLTCKLYCHNLNVFHNDLCILNLFNIILAL